MVPSNALISQVNFQFSQILNFDLLFFLSTFFPLFFVFPIQLRVIMRVNDKSPINLTNRKEKNRKKTGKIISLTFRTVMQRKETKGTEYILIVRSQQIMISDQNDDI